MCKFAKFQILQYQVIKQKVCNNKNCAKYDRLTIFEKALSTTNSNMQKYLKIFQKLNLYLRKTENVQILFINICVKIYATFTR